MYRQFVVWLKFAGPYKSFLAGLTLGLVIMLAPVCFLSDKLTEATEMAADCQKQAFNMVTTLQKSHNEQVARRHEAQARADEYRRMLGMVGDAVTRKKLPPLVIRDPFVPEHRLEDRK